MELTATLEGALTKKYPLVPKNSISLSVFEKAARLRCHWLSLACAQDYDMKIRTTRQSSQSDDF